MKRGADADRQETIIEALSHASWWGVAPEAFTVMETHLAVIFLAGPSAFKMKKSVDLGYLDFTSLEKRKAVLDTELVLNRVTAPALYRGVRAVTAAPDGTLALEGTGETVEWVLEMERFDQADMLSVMADRGQLGLDQATPLAEAVIRLHRTVPCCRTSGWDAASGRVIASSAEHLAFAADEGVLRPGPVAALIGRTRTEHARHTALLEARAGKGHVRRCHGDLHLANIVMRQGRPMPFDCIEFSEDIACIDTLYDLAFLLMDVRKRGLEPFANRILNAYLAGLAGEDRGDAQDGLALLPLYLSMRAAIRAHVTAQTVIGRAGRIGGAERARLIDMADGYVALAVDLLRLVRPRLVAVGGLSGTGKSTLAFALAPHLEGPAGAVVLRTDEIRKRAFGVAPGETLPPEAYAPEASPRIYGYTVDEARRVLAAGQSVILDGVFARPEQRAAVETLCHEADVPLTAFWLEADRDTMAGRVAARRGDVSDATPAVVDRQLTYDLGAMTWTRLDAARPLDAVAGEALAILTGA